MLIEQAPSLIHQRGLTILQYEDVPSEPYVARGEDAIQKNGGTTQLLVAA